ncbi:MAG: RidA family protein [Mycobacteriales bacterium]|jgi:2-iminobutanoate/2-iminopropanoate deaminase
MPSIGYSTSGAPAPAGPYSQGVRRGSVLALAGQAGFDPATGQLVDGVAAQTRQALTNLGAVLAEAGASFADVVMMRVYLTDPEHFAVMNQVYSEFVTAPFPGRTTVYVGLPPGMLVEIDGLAVLE